MTALQPLHPRFFRDADGLTQLLRAVRRMPLPEPHSAIRLWVPSSSTGEDAYSAAMSFLDGLARARRRCRVRVLATGPNAATIRRARRAVYGAAIHSQMPAARLRRFFARHEEGYRVADHVRGLCVFGMHDLEHNVPFVRLDAIYCPLPLWRWSEAARQRALDVFHYALKSGGLLLVGGAGAIPSDDFRFTRSGNGDRIYLRRDLPAGGTGRLQRILRSAEAAGR